MVWPPGLRDAWTKYTPPAWIKNQLGPKHLGERWGLDGPLLERLSAKKESESARAKTTATFSAAVTARLRRHFTGYGAHLRTLPPHVAEMLIRAYGSQRWFGETEVFRVYAAEHGEMFLEAFLAYASAHLEDGLPLLLPYRDPRIAPLAADALHRLKKKPPAARGWLLAHPEAAALGLVPAAVGKLGKSRDAAGAALRFLAREGHQDVVLAVARRYGGPAETAVREVFAFDPMAHVPSKMPALPDFARVDVLPRLVLRGEGGTEGASLPLDAMKHVLSMLQISTLDDPYAGVAALVELTTPSSRGELAWELFQSWSVSGASPKEAWAFAAMGFFGDDEVRAKASRRWCARGRARRQHAARGDRARGAGERSAPTWRLMHLQRHRAEAEVQGPARDRAREKIEQIAEARGLTRRRARRSARARPGPRRRRLAGARRSERASVPGRRSTSRCEPFVRDAANARLVGELPKPKQGRRSRRWPSRGDRDVEGAQEGREGRSRQQQVVRLELSMCGRRRWPRGRVPTLPRGASAGASPGHAARVGRVCR
jgi:hypothetical protein